MWAWTALDSDTKLMVTWAVSPTTAQPPSTVDLRSRTTDDLPADGLGLSRSRLSHRLRANQAVCPTIPDSPSAACDGRGRQTKAHQHVLERSMSMHGEPPSRSNSTITVAGKTPTHWSPHHPQRHSGNMAAGPCISPTGPRRYRPRQGKRVIQTLPSSFLIHSLLFTPS